MKTSFSFGKIYNRRLKDSDELQELFSQMIMLRDQIARNADFPNYLEYVFPLKNRFEYSPEDCLKFHQAVEKLAVPFLKKLDNKRMNDLELKSLRPWDIQVDPLGREPLKPCETGEEMAQKCKIVFNNIDTELGDQFQQMIDKGLLDLDSRKGKAPGGYQSTLSEIRLPFIFMNSSGTNKDVYTLLHEGGHAFHAFASRDMRQYSYRHAPIEFCEVASMGMELMCSDRLSPFYNDAERGRSLRDHLEGTISFFPWCATIDAFQHWLYSNPKHSIEERTSTWLDLMKRFGHKIDWSDLEQFEKVTWQAQQHLFTVPFYYIEYGIAQIGALQLWMNFRKDPEAALKAYKHALSLGGSKPLPELFEAAGLKFDFSEETLGPIVNEVEKILQTLPL